MVEIYIFFCSVVSVSLIKIRLYFGFCYSCFVNYSNLFCLLNFFVTFILYPEKTTFSVSDFRVEREYLWEAVLPELQHHFLPHGLDIQLIDLHLGTCLDPSFDSGAVSRMLREIDECHNRSLGPFFLVGVR